MLEMLSPHTISQTILVPLHFVAVVLLIAVAGFWGRHGRRRYFVASGVLTLVAILGIYLATVRPGAIPIDWITVLHEGLGWQSILHLYTRGVHVGENFHAVVSAVAGLQPTLHDVVWLNLLLALVNAAIFLHLAIYIAGRAWGLAWTLVFALNPITFLASFSELPTNLLGLYGLAGILAWATIKDDSEQPVLIRSSAYLLCVLLTVFAGFTRIEVAIVGATALAIDAVHAMIGPAKWLAGWQRLLSACEKPIAYLSDHLGIVVVLCLLGVWFTQSGLPWGLLGRSEVAGLYPFNPSILSLFIFLPMILLPAGVSVAIFFGSIHATVHFRRFGGLVLSLLVLVRTYFSAQDQYYETGRYLSYIFPFIFSLGLFGADQFNEIVRRWCPSWYYWARVGYVMAWFTRALPGTPDFYLRPEYFKESGFAQIFLDRNTQREIRHLLTVTAENPECVFIGRVVESYHYPDRPREYAYAIFGRPIPEPRFVSESQATIDDVVQRHAPGAACVRLYFGGDCNLTNTDGCKQFIAGRRLIDEERFWSRLYNNPADYGYGKPEIVLATYAWP